MTMAVDQSQSRYALGGGYDNMHSYAQHHHAGPHFTNPWSTPSASAANQQQPTASPSMYGNLSQHTSLTGMEGLRPQHHQQLPQPIQQQQHHQQHQHQHQHHQQQHSPISGHQQAPSHQQQQAQHPYHQQQTQHHQQQQQHQEPRLPQPISQQQQQLPPAPMHRPGNTSLPSSMGMSASQSQSPHSRTTLADPVGYRNDLLIATTSAAYPDSTAAYSAPSPIHPTAAYATAAAAAAPYDQMGYAPAAHLRGAPGAPGVGFGLDANAAVDVARRFSQPDNSHAVLGSAGGNDRRGFQDAIEASHGIMSLSQDTPRPGAYQTGTGAGERSASRDSVHSYGFPHTHSTSSSVSGQSFHSFYGGGSVDSNISDYSTGNSDLESVGSRHRNMPAVMSTGMSTGMPSAHGMHPHHRASFANSVPPPAQSMMGQFNSKVTSTTQKKHKCKVCEKRFTRPSSLQTHMYSHTGEKPFACDVPGCGRNFSVVSNLRRHKKVHKDLSPSETGSEGHHHSPE
ncbi:hypothetical protein SCUCBS95973_002195 [Sporothrix curviconia]|uniref:C2H2-type domain-containing protein n=1 Tax=Sporothrix curviconia TaxID=1260050 RepID=A0ABP0B5P8_9PEZI